MKKADDVSGTATHLQYGSFEASIVAEKNKYTNLVVANVASIVQLFCCNEMILHLE
ncbi:hypothetical protein [Nostoc sp.]|uniref:hypothetical protein n=1 Tax=Nostoc sp. TaxID=1180 RepID=UPI002FF6B679